MPSPYEPVRILRFPSGIYARLVTSLTRDTAPHAVLARVLPELERRARRLVPEHRHGCLGVAGEDLVQFAALAALSRLEAARRAGAPLPDWWQSDERLGSYMSGLMRRRLMRVLRDQRERAGSLVPEGIPAASEPEPGSRRERRQRVRACLAGIAPQELRAFARFGQGRSYEELAPGLRVTPDTLAKRRVRALAGLRERCRSCPLRRQQGCAWIPRGWLGPVSSS
jgi:DNA-directed RNA polymerase specialized sigma24 family protein